jgi:hypothetical protein
MKTGKLAAILTMAAVILSATCALAEEAATASADPTAGLEIVSIKKIQVQKNSQDYYYLDVTINLRNSSGSDIRLKDNVFNFALGAERQGEAPVPSRYIGKATPDTIELKNVRTSADPGQAVELVVGLGSNQETVLDKLSYVMNTVGDPANKVTIAISGKTKTWKQVKNGWLSSGMTEMELIYHPKIEREVLIE